MKPLKNQDWSVMTMKADCCGLRPAKDRMGNIRPGFYTYKGLNAPVDLSACAEDQDAILRTALMQLSEQVDEMHQQVIEKDINN